MFTRYRRRNFARFPVLQADGPSEECFQGSESGKQYNNKNKEKHQRNKTSLQTWTRRWQKKHGIPNPLFCKSDFYGKINKSRDIRKPSNSNALTDSNKSDTQQTEILITQNIKGMRPPCKHGPGHGRKKHGIQNPLLCKSDSYAKLNKP